jgi:PAS domain S-box-containing protein
MLDKHYSEKRTKLLIDIVSQNNEDLDDQLYYALESTSELLGMEIGLISSIWSNKYIVEHFSPEGIDMYKGQNFELGNTYCSITLEADGVFSVANMGKSEYNMHPCYNSFHLESYIGVPIEVEGRLYGTINFSSSKPNKKGFSKADHDLITLLGEWASGVIYRKKMEENLVREKEGYEVLSKNSSELICLHKPDGTYTFVSESSVEILGYSSEELIGTSPYKLIHPDDLEDSAQPSHEKVGQGIPVGDIQYRMKQKNGNYIWVQASAEPVINSFGDVTAIQTTSRDITEKKRMEFMLNESQRMASVGGWEFDVKSGKLYWTDEVYRIHDKEIGSEVMVDEGLSYFPEESRVKIQKALEKAVEDGETYDLELKFISAKNVKKWVRAIGYAYIIDGKAVKIRGTFQDITKQVEAEKKITDQNKILAKNEEEKEKLYSIIAHDLRGGFNGIIGLLEILKEDFESLNLEEQYWQKLRLVINSAKNANQLMENLLKWIRVQNTFLPSSDKSVNINSLITDCETFLKPSLLKKGIEIVNEVNSFELRGDKDMLATVFRNLISNAVKFSKPDSQVIVTGKKIDSQNSEFRIKDFGIGMSPEVIENLFNKAHRPKRLGTNKEKGTGLGLILCNELVELHGGTISVESSEDNGSEFIVNLPLDGK